MDYTMAECGGCLTCEIACSYKHNKEFNHLISSIEIVELENEQGYKVRLIEDTSTGRIPCDGCLGDEPMCLSYCPKHEELKAILTRHISERIKKGESKDE